MGDVEQGVQELPLAIISMLKNSETLTGKSHTHDRNSSTQDCWNHDICSYFNNASGGARYDLFCAFGC